MNDPPRRKRRDSFEDQLGAPVYTGEPTPPFPSVIHNLVYISYRCDPDGARRLLPPGLTLIDPITVTVALLEIGSGWGLNDTTFGFFALAVEEHAAADTSESGYFAFAVMPEPSRSLASRYFGTFREGGCDIRQEGDLIYARMLDAQNGDIVRIVLRVSGPLQPQAANDQYIGRAEDGTLLLSLTSVAGPAQPCEIVSFDVADTAPPEVQSIAPQQLLFAVFDPELVFSWNALGPILPPPNPGLTGRSLLLDLLDRQARPCVILDAGGHVIEANRGAQALLAETPPGCRDPIRPVRAEDAARFCRQLADLAAAPSPLASVQALLPRGEAKGPLIVQVMPTDPDFAGPGMLLALITDPGHRPIVRDPSVFQLLGLTPAEARIAAAVGSGLPPREAATRLGLTENTVRSSLKIVYDKLGICRQAELAQIVARFSEA